MADLHGTQLSFTHRQRDSEIKEDEVIEEESIIKGVEEIKPTMADPQTQENLHGTPMSVTHPPRDSEIKEDAVIEEETVIKGVEEIKPTMADPQTQENLQGTPMSVTHPPRDSEIKEDSVIKELGASGTQRKEPKQQEERREQALARFKSVDARLDEAKARQEAVKKEVDEIENEANAAIDHVASLTSYTAYQIATFQGELLLGAIMYRPIRDFISASFTSIVNSVRTFISTSWNSLKNFMPILGYGILNLLCDYADDNTSKKLAVMWKVFMSLAFGLSFKSKHLHRISGGHQAKKLVIVLAVLIGSFIVVNRQNYWKRFIETQRKKRPGWYGSRNFQILNPLFRNVVIIAVATTFTAGSLMLSSYGEEKDLFGGFATLSLALGVILYERTLGDDRGLSEGIITLQGSLWAGPYKNTRWVFEWVFGSVFGLYARFLNGYLVLSLVSMPGVNVR